MTKRWINSSKKVGIMFLVTFPTNGIKGLFAENSFIPQSGDWGTGAGKIGGRDAIYFNGPIFIRGD